MLRLRSLLLRWLLMPSLLLWAGGFALGYLAQPGRRRTRPSTARCSARRWCSASTC